MKKKIFYNNQKYDMEKELNYEIVSNYKETKWFIVITDIDKKPLKTPLISRMYDSYEGLYSLVMSIDSFIYKNTDYLDF